MKCANLNFKKEKFKFLLTTIIRFVLLIKNLKEGITLRTGLRNTNRQVKPIYNCGRRNPFCNNC